MKTLVALSLVTLIIAPSLRGQAPVNRILEERVIPWDPPNQLQLRSVLIKPDDLMEMGYDLAYAYVALYQIIQQSEEGPDIILSEEPFSAVKFRILFVESKNPDVDIYRTTKELFEHFHIPHENLSYFPPEEAVVSWFIEEVPYKSLDALAYLSLFSARIPQLSVTSGPEPLSGYYPFAPSWWNYEYATPFLDVAIDTYSGKRDTWFGEINDAMFPIVEHPGHGLVEVEYTRHEGILHLWWEDTVFGRCYTREEIHPYFYCERDDEWLYYLPGSNSPRWFYSLKYEAWGQYP